MKKGILTLAGAIAALRRHHGAPEGPPTSDPFELVLLENVAYLATPERRRIAFEELRRTVGAEKILLFSGAHALLAPESNGLRVMTRLGVIREEKSYSRTYVAARLAAEELPHTIAGMQEAHLLLQRHGQTLCRRANPQCSACPLAPRCACAAREAR